jgi:hypothetical protein
MIPDHKDYPEYSQHGQSPCASSGEVVPPSGINEKNASAVRQPEPSDQAKDHKAPSNKESPSVQCVLTVSGGRLVGALPQFAELAVPPKVQEATYLADDYTVEVTFQDAGNTNAVSKLRIVSKAADGHHSVRYTLASVPDKELGAALANAIREHTDSSLRPLPTLLSIISKIVPISPGTWITEVITESGIHQARPDEPAEILVLSNRTLVAKKLTPAFEDFANDPTAARNAFTAGAYENGERVRIDAFIDPKNNLGTLRIRTFDAYGKKCREELLNFQDQTETDPKKFQHALSKKLFTILESYDPHGMRGVRTAARAAHEETGRNTAEQQTSRQDRLELGVLDSATCERIVALSSGAYILLEVAGSIAALQIRTNGTPNATATTWLVDAHNGNSDFASKVVTLRKAIAGLRSNVDRIVCKTVEQLDQLTNGARSNHIQSALPFAILGAEAVAQIKNLTGLEIKAAEPSAAQLVADLLRGRETIDIYFPSPDWNSQHPEHFSNLRISLNPIGGAYIRLSNMMRGRVNAYLSPAALNARGGINKVAIRLSQAFAGQIYGSRLTAHRELEHLAQADAARSWCFSQSDGYGLDMPEAHDLPGQRAYDTAALLFKSYRDLKMTDPYQFLVTYDAPGTCNVTLEDKTHRTAMVLSVVPEGINQIEISGPHPAIKDYREQSSYSTPGNIPALPLFKPEDLHRLLLLFRFYSLTRTSKTSVPLEHSELLSFVETAMLRWCNKHS